MVRLLCSEVVFVRNKSLGRFVNSSSGRGRVEVAQRFWVVDNEDWVHGDDNCVLSEFHDASVSDTPREIIREKIQTDHFPQCRECVSRQILGNKFSQSDARAEVAGGSIASFLALGMASASISFDLSPMKRRPDSVDAKFAHERKRLIFEIYECSEGTYSNGKERTRATRWSCWGRPSKYPLALFCYPLRIPWSSCRWGRTWAVAWKTRCTWVRTPVNITQGCAILGDKHVEHFAGELWYQNLTCIDIITNNFKLLSEKFGLKYRGK